MNCPECNAQLTREDHHGIQLDVCEGCQGLWFDRGELEAYWSASNTAGQPPDVKATESRDHGDDSPLTCPGCANDTLSLRWTDVFIGGSCAECHGVWLTPARGNKIPERRVPGRVPPGWLDLTNLEPILDLLVRHFR